MVSPSGETSHDSARPDELQVFVVPDQTVVDKTGNGVGSTIGCKKWYEVRRLADGAFHEGVAIGGFIIMGAALGAAPATGCMR